MKNDRPISLAEYINYLQSKGNYILIKRDALITLGISSPSFNTAAARLVQKERLLNVKQGFYIIVPLEYKIAGAIPVSWFIDDLMRFKKQEYYVGLLSAAALYGAAHQQPQEFQIISNKISPSIMVGRTKIHFFLKRKINNLFIDKIKTASGYMSVSIPELTAFDLLKYINAGGQIHNVATAIIGLAEKMDAKKLSEVALDFELPIIQRLGYILDTFAEYTVTSILHKWFCKQKIIFTSLVPAKAIANVEKNQKWKIWINEIIEVD